MNAKQEGVETLSVFISHRHKDKDIANVFREAIEDWSNCQVKVFQSSHAESALSIGDDLDDSIKRAVADSNVVLLIYTAADADWAWCMYECGLAQDPDSMDTRIVVFHTSEELPGPLQNLITVPMSEESVKTLTDDFHRDVGFFPKLQHAFAPDLDDDQIEQRSMELYKNLRKAIPTTKAKEWQRYDHMTLALSLEDVKQVEQIDEEADYKKSLKCAKQLINQNCVVKEFFGEPQAHFNFEEITENLKFSTLVERWRKESEYANLSWDEELYEEMARAMLNRKEGAVSVPFNSVEPDSKTWLLPVVVRTRVVPEEKIMKFDILFCTIQSRVAEIMIKLDK